ncbi:o-succinylbenzoate--CoA ligase [Mycolicibacterium rhodesiae JS60]|nr:o-succinylbenzoate--CoA ligase [Mycolicibacterium rhodesiae JS60]
MTETTSLAPTFNFADLWELVCAALPERTAIVCGEQRRSFAELDDRAARLAAWMKAREVGPGTFVGVQMRNSIEYVETTLAAYKLRAIPININYRLLEAELIHLYLDSGLVGVVHDSDLGARIQTVLPAAPDLSWTLCRGAEYEAAIAASPPLSPSAGRSGDDPYVLYTGGTTGKPKGVVWRMEDAFFACIGGGDPTASLGPISRPDQIVERIQDGYAFLPAAPLIHAAGMWTTLRWLLAGAKVVLLPDFSPEQIWRAIAAERVTVMNIVGDAMARPLVDALAVCDNLDLSCLRTIATGGAPLSPGTRTQLTAALPQLTIKDSYGSSETGVHGWSVHTSGSSDKTRFAVVDTVILDEATRAELPAGSTQAGLVARRGRVPIRYHNDEKRSTATFLTKDGRRYALTGDFAHLDADGGLRLLGRGSQCINTGGEKVFPEEVEEVVRAHPAVMDAVVIGAADPKWGQRVTAIVATAAGRSITSAELRAHCRETIAAFKVPKNVVFVDEVHRTAAGKADYVWAAALANSLIDTPQG